MKIEYVLVLIIYISCAQPQNVDCLEQDHTKLQSIEFSAKNISLPDFGYSDLKKTITTHKESLIKNQYVNNYELDKLIQEIRDFEKNIKQYFESHISDLDNRDLYQKEINSYLLILHEDNEHICDAPPCMFIEFLTHLQGRIDRFRYLVHNRLEALKLYKGDRFFPSLGIITYPDHEQNSLSISLNINHRIDEGGVRRDLIVDKSLSQRLEFYVVDTLGYAIISPPYYCRKSHE